MIKSFLKEKQGFTLIEIVAVLAIIGVMAVMLVPSIDIASNRTKDTKMLSDLVTIDSAVKLYQFETGSLPESIEELKGTYIPSKTYKDTQGNPFTYTPSTTTAGTTYTLTGKNTNGDIVSSDGTKEKASA